MPKRRVTTAAQKAAAKRNLVKARAARARGRTPQTKGQRAMMRGAKGSSRGLPMSSNDIISRAVGSTPGLGGTIRNTTRNSNRIAAHMKRNRKAFVSLVHSGKLMQGTGWSADAFWTKGARPPRRKRL